MPEAAPKSLFVAKIGKEKRHDGVRNVLWVWIFRSSERRGMTGQRVLAIVGLVISFQRFCRRPA